MDKGGWMMEGGVMREGRGWGWKEVENEGRRKRGEDLGRLGKGRRKDGGGCGGGW